MNQNLKGNQRITVVVDKPNSKAEVYKIQRKHWLCLEKMLQGGGQLNPYERNPKYECLVQNGDTISFQGTAELESFPKGTRIFLKKTSARSKKSWARIAEIDQMLSTGSILNPKQVFELLTERFMKSYKDFTAEEAKRLCEELNAEPATCREVYLSLVS